MTSAHARNAEQAVTVDVRDLVAALYYNPAKHQHDYPGLQADGTECEACRAVFRLWWAVRRKDFAAEADLPGDSLVALRRLVLRWNAMHWNADAQTWATHPDAHRGIAPWRSEDELELSPFQSARHQARIDGLVECGLLVEEHLADGRWRLQLTAAGIKFAVDLALNSTERMCGCHLCGYRQPTVRNEQFNARYCEQCAAFVVEWAAAHADEIAADDRAEAEILAAQDDGTR